MYMYTAWTPLILLAFALSLWAQYRVKGTFVRYEKTPVSSGITGYEAARRMLDGNGLHNIPIEPVPGKLSDHYDPLSKTVRLSESVYYGNSISSVSVACHEVGHAVQDKVHYPMLVARHRMFPLVNFASGIAPFLLIGGFLFKFSGLLLLGIVFFSAAVLFQVVTLPVEFNASARAKEQMVGLGFIRNEEESLAGKVLGAAALTYVAAAIMSILQLLEYIWIFNRSND